MSYKEEIHALLEQIGAEAEKEMGKETEKIEKALSVIYTRALEEAQKTGQSIESITYEILEGLEERLGSRFDKEEMAQLLHAISQKITQIIHTFAQDRISHSERNLQIAMERHTETVEREKAHLLESMEAFKAFAADHAYETWKKKLQELEKRISDLLSSLTTHS